MLTRGIRHHVFRHRESGDLLFILEVSGEAVVGLVLTTPNAEKRGGGFFSKGPDLWKRLTVGLDTLVKGWSDMGPSFREERSPVIGFAVVHGPDCDCFGGKTEPTEEDRKRVN